MPLQNIYGFASSATKQQMYLFGGFILKDYKDESEDLYNFHTPQVNRGKLLPLSSVLYHIDIDMGTISSLHAPSEYGTANATMHLTDTDIFGKVDRLLILGGTSKQIILYANSKFEIVKCELEEELGGCMLEEMTPTTVTNTCTKCGKKIHKECDRHINMKKGPNYRRPDCKGIRIQTVKPKLCRNRRGSQVNYAVF